MTADPHFDKEHTIMTLFIDNAKTYTQMSSAALALTITFVRDVLGLKADQPVPRDGLLIAAWILLLIAAGAGGYYQYLGVKFLEWKSGLGALRSHPAWPELLIHHPWPVYLLMLASFYAGMGLFAASAVRRLLMSSTC